MTARLYPHGKGAMLRAQVNWLKDDIRVALLDEGMYVPDFSNHAYLNDVQEKAILDTLPLTGRTLEVNVAGGADIYYPMVSVGRPSAVLIYSKVERKAKSVLLLYTDEVDGLPFSANGSDFWLRWSKGTSKIFTL